MCFDLKKQNACCGQFTHCMIRVITTVDWALQLSQETALFWANASHAITEMTHLNYCARCAETNTYPPCSKNVCTHSFVCLSHNLTVLSSLPETISRPSGENLEFTSEIYYLQLNVKYYNDYMHFQIKGISFITISRLPGTSHPIHVLS